MPTITMLKCNVLKNTTRYILLAHLGWTACVWVTLDPMEIDLIISQPRPTLRLQSLFAGWPLVSNQADIHVSPSFSNFLYFTFSSFTLINPFILITSGGDKLSSNKFCKYSVVIFQKVMGVIFSKSFVYNFVSFQNRKLCRYFFSKKGDEKFGDVVLLKFMQISCVSIYIIFQK